MKKMKKKQHARWNQPRDLVAMYERGAISDRDYQRAKKALRRGHTHVTVTSPRKKLKHRTSTAINRSMRSRR